MDIRMLGPLAVERDGTGVELGIPRQRSLFALLVLGRGAVIATDRLAEDLWDGAPPRTARHTVQSYVHRLRTVLGPDGGRLETRGSSYRLVCLHEEVDAQRFADLAERGRRILADGNPSEALRLLDAAVGLWRGPPLADLPTLHAFAPERTRLDGLYVRTLTDRCEAALALGRHEVVEELETLAVAHPFRERLWRLWMLALYQGGRQADALHVFQRARGTLRDQLGVEPDPQLVRLHERILRQDPSLDPGAAQRSGPALMNVPDPRTRLIGRRRELDELDGLLATRRLVTIVGPPGCGKTRVSLEAARRSRDAFPHGVHFVSLADIDDPESVPDAVATGLGVTASDRSPQEALVGFLRPRRVLVVIDNVEQVSSAAVLLSDLLDAAPGLRILATSRTPLRLSGEQVYPLDPLPLTTPDEPGPDPLGSDAVALFVDRARHVAPSFAVGEDGGRDVAAIVARTDGLPLAIELAAARLRQLPLAEPRRRLDPALPLLTAGPVDQPPRQRTMRAAIAWSDALLGDADRVLFGRLGVFRGGFTLDAADAVACGVSGSPADVAGGVARLVDAGLVQPPMQSGAARYALLEPVREYAIERLRTSDSHADVCRRHAGFFSGLVERAEPELVRVGMRGWLDRLEDEHANLRAALYAMQATGDVEDGLGMAGRLWRFWQLRGHATEGRRTLEGLLARPAAPRAGRARAAALIGLAGLCYWQGAMAAAEMHYTDALAIIDPSANEWLYAETLFGLIDTLVCHRGRPEAADVHHKNLERVVENQGLAVADAALLTTTGMIRLVGGDLDGASAAWERSLKITSEVGELWWQAQTLRGLGGIDLARQRYADARSRLLASLDILWSVGDLVGVAQNLERLGLVVAAMGRPTDGVALAGAADRLKESVGGAPPIEALLGGLPSPRAVAERALSEDAVDRAWTHGRAMSIVEAVMAAHE